MRLATTLFLALTASSVMAAPLAGTDHLRGGRVQVMAVNLADLRHEFFDVGWMSSYYVRLTDTYESFVSGQFNRLSSGEYMGLMPEVRKLAEALDDEAPRSGARTIRGGWEPVGWGDCDGRDLVLLKRRVR